jgi:hypothetical protein
VNDAAQFKGDDIENQFDSHDCKPLDSSQDALRVVRGSHRKQVALSLSLSL